MDKENKRRVTEIIPEMPEDERLRKSMEITEKLLKLIGALKKTNKV